jgi:hypothetical protein
MSYSGLLINKESVQCVDGKVEKSSLRSFLLMKKHREENVPGNAALAVCFAASELRED